MTDCQLDSNEKTCTRRYWIIVALFVFNSIALAQSAYALLSWPTNANISFSSKDVNVNTTYDVDDGSPFYVVDVPLKIFPFDAQLKQRVRFAPVSLSSMNVLLLLVLVNTYRTRPLRFSLRTLFVVMTIVAVAFLLVSLLEVP